MAESTTVTARLPRNYRERLDALLREGGFSSIGQWLVQTLDTIEDVRKLGSRADQLRGEIRELGRRAERYYSVLPLLEKSGITPKDLAQELDKYKDLSTACRELKREKRDLEVAVKALKNRRAEVEVFLTASQESLGKFAQAAEARFKKVADTAQGEVERLARNAHKLADFKAMIERLRAEHQETLPLAVAFQAMAGPPEAAEEIHPDMILLILDRLLRWTDATGKNPVTNPPSRVAGNKLIKFEKLPLTDVLFWAVVAVAGLCEKEGG